MPLGSSGPDSPEHAARSSKSRDQPEEGGQASVRTNARRDGQVPSPPSTLGCQTDCNVRVVANGVGVGMLQGGQVRGGGRGEERGAKGEGRGGEGEREGWEEGRGR